MDDEEHTPDFSRTWSDHSTRTIGGHTHRHGRPGSWVLVATVIAAFVVGGVSVIEHWWWGFWACAGIVLLAIPAGKAVGIMDDTD